MTHPCTTEKTIIIGKPSKKLRQLFLLIGLALLAVFLVLYIFNVDACRFYEGSFGRYQKTLFDIILFNTILPSLAFDLGLLFCLIGAIFYIAWLKVAITVSDKRVYGTGIWGKRVDLPLDLISAVSTSNFKGITVSSSSGAIAFKLIENYRDIHQAISDLLIERQQKVAISEVPVIKQELQQSVADELKKYKELLDSGIITEEEFNAKKKQLLGL